MYRSFTYFYLLALALMSLCFVHTYHGISSTDVAYENAHQNLLTNQQAPKHIFEKPETKPQLVEVLDESQSPDLQKKLFLGTRASHGKNKSSDYNSTYQVAHVSQKNKLREKLSSSAQQQSHPIFPFASAGQTQFLDELAKSKQENPQKNRDVQKSQAISDDFNIKDTKSRYFQGKSVRKFSMRMNQNGDFSINAMDFPGAEYLIQVAKSIFHYWVDFIPVNMIEWGFIKTDDVGSMSSILVFSRDTPSQNDYKINFLKPFISNNLNQSTLSAFKYYHMPSSQKVMIQKVGVEFKIYKDSLTISANFEFQLFQDKK